MILFLRTQDNETIVDIEVWQEKQFCDLKAFIDVEMYSYLLLDIEDEEDRMGAIYTFSMLQELRGWIHETRESNKPDDYKEIVDELREHLLEIAETYNLKYVED